MKNSRRVVVTGMGALTPVGLNVEESWDSVKNGRSGVAPIALFDHSEFPVKIAGEVKGFDPETYIPKKEIKKMDRFIQLSLGATEMAWEDSGLGELSETDQIRAGALIGVGVGGLPAIEMQHDILKARGPNKMGPFFIPMVISNMASGHISIRHKIKGPNFAITSACASGAHAIGEAKRHIEMGVADIMIAGGSEACVCPMAVSGFSAMKALSRRNEQPERASRPWDSDRDGFVIAEGAATLVLEELGHAEKRGANILGEIVGYGLSSDAYHMTNPSEGGEGAARAMQLALADADMAPEQVNYVNAHGTSTGAGDIAENQAIHKVFSEHANKLMVSSTKSMTGHTLGAAGAIESVFCVKSLGEQWVPPTINLEQQDPACDLDFVANKGRAESLSTVMNNSFGFGGTNACLIFSKS